MYRKTSRDINSTGSQLQKPPQLNSCEAHQAPKNIPISIKYPMGVTLVRFADVCKKQNCL